MSSLALQLQQIASTDAGFGDGGHKTRGVPSVLSEAREAADRGLEDVLEAATDGLLELIPHHPHFSHFLSNLFHKKWLKTDIEMLQRDQMREVGTTIDLFFSQICHVFLEPSAQKAIEWLVRYFNVCRERVASVLACILPYHDTIYFPKYLRLLELDTTWSFLAQARRNSTTVTRSFLAQRLGCDANLIQLLDDSFVSAIRLCKEKPSEDVSTVISFVSLVLAEYVDLLPAMTGDQYLGISSLIENGLKARHCPAAQMAMAALFISCLSRAPLSDSHVSDIIDSIAQNFGDAINNEALVAINGILTVRDNGELFSQKAFSFISKCENLPDNLSKLKTNYNCRLFLLRMAMSIGENRTKNEKFKSLADSFSKLCKEDSTLFMDMSVPLYSERLRVYNSLEHSNNLRPFSDLLDRIAACTNLDRIRDVIFEAVLAAIGSNSEAVLQRTAEFLSASCACAQTVTEFALSQCAVPNSMQYLFSLLSTDSRIVRTGAAFVLGNYLSQNAMDEQSIDALCGATASFRGKLSWIDAPMGTLPGSFEECFSKLLTLSITKADQSHSKAMLKFFLTEYAKCRDLVFGTLSRCKDQCLPLILDCLDHDIPSTFQLLLGFLSSQPKMPKKNSVSVFFRLISCSNISAQNVRILHWKCFCELERLMKKLEKSRTDTEIRVGEISGELFGLLAEKDQKVLMAHLIGDWRLVSSSAAVRQFAFTSSVFASVFKDFAKQLEHFNDPSKQKKLKKEFELGAQLLLLESYFEIAHSYLPEDGSIPMLLSDILGQMLSLPEDVMLSVDYTVDLLLLLLLKLSQRAGFSANGINLGFVVQAMRSFPNPQVQRTVLQLLTRLSLVCPVALLDNILPVFTFMGSNTSGLDNEYSFQVIRETIATIIPALAGSGSFDAKSIVGVFVDAFEHIPKHRRPILFQTLLETVGKNMFVHFCELMARHISRAGEYNVDVVELANQLVADLNMPGPLLADASAALVARATDGLKAEKELEGPLSARHSVLKFAHEFISENSAPVKKSSPSSKRLKNGVFQAVCSVDELRQNASVSEKTKKQLASMFKVLMDIGDVLGMELKSSDLK